VLVVLWASLPLTAGPALSEALDGRSSAVVATVVAGAWTCWGVVLAAALVPTTVSLTVVRLLAPLAPVAAILAGLAGAGALVTTVATAVATAAAALAFTAEVGTRFVQGSAYGDEARFPLRPPGPLVVGPLPIGWALAAAGVIGGPLLLACGELVAGLPVTAAGVAWAALFALRCHRLARRFVVFVPAGFVVHDHVALVDTALFLRASVAGFRLAPADTGAADLTARALGTAVEFQLREPGTVVLVDPSRPGGRALHLTAGLVSPSRPGRVLAEAARRGHAVG
jgi:hypothetical protein